MQTVTYGVPGGVVERRIGVSVLCCNRLLRESISRILAKKADFQVHVAQPIMTAGRENIAPPGTDVLVLDSLQAVANVTSSISLTRDEGPAISCVLIAMGDDKNQFVAAVRHGVLGYVLQEASAVDVVAAIRAVSQGEAVCPPRLARVLFDYVASHAVHLPNTRTRAQLGLTRREQQLVPMISRGLTNKEIAAHLNLSEQTIKSHIHRILRKVGVDDRLSVFEACQVHRLSL